MWIGLVFLLAGIGLFLFGLRQMHSLALVNKRDRFQEFVAYAILVLGCASLMTSVAFV